MSSPITLRGLLRSCILLRGGEITHMLCRHTHGLGRDAIEGDIGMFRCRGRSMRRLRKKPMRSTSASMFLAAGDCGACSSHAIELTEVSGLGSSRLSSAANCASVNPLVRHDRRPIPPAHALVAPAFRARAESVIGRVAAASLPATSRAACQAGEWSERSGSAKQGSAGTRPDRTSDSRTAPSDPRAARGAFDLVAGTCRR